MYSYAWQIIFTDLIELYSLEMAALPPISREQAFLETYFQCISQFAYDKAREQCVSILTPKYLCQDNPL